ncbi:MAG: molecular chaperone HtpG [Rikenellaceae bacterium]
MKQGNIGVTTENIFPIIKKFLYSDHEIFLRELVSNAVDATTKLQTLIQKGEAAIEGYEPKVTVMVDEDARTITISDMGIGMTEEEVEKYINQIALSGAEEFMAKYQDTTGIIGHFGLGFYSAFMVADKVELTTKSFSEGSEAVKWSCDGSPSYTLEKAEREGNGTDITLYIAEDSLEFASKSRIEGLLKKYSAFLPVQIFFGENQINDTKPLWKETPSEITDEQYTEFYHKLYPMADEPLFNIHLNVDYPFNLTGILYFPQIKNNIEVQKNKIQLYCNQVFVTDSVEGIVPEFLTLLHGVIDSPDIPLNVSRSYLQSDSNVKKISNHITKKVADRLADIFKTSREEYERKWNDLKLFIQYGVVSNEKFGERADDFTLLRTSEDKYYALTQYADLIKDTQTDKNGKIVHLYASDAVAEHSYIAAAKAKGYDVLIMDSPLESHFIGFLEQKHSDWSFVRVDSAPAEKLIEKEVEETLSLSEEQQNEVKELFTGAVVETEKVKFNVEVSAMDSSAQPVVITQHEFMRRMKDMSKVGGGGFNMYGEMPDSYTVTINGNSEVVTSILAKGSDEQSTTAKSLVDLALLSAGLLKGEALTAFVERQMAAIK